MSKIKNIEFLRVFLMLGIVLMHSFIDMSWNITNLYPDIQIFQTIHKCCCHASNGVEAFFIISGFLLVITFKNTISVKDFIIKKYKRLSPVILGTMGICFIGYLLGTMTFPVWKNILAVFLLNTPIISIGAVSCGSAWYTSALFVGLLIYFCIIKFASPKTKNILMVCLIALGYGILEHFRHGVYSHPTLNINGIFNVGMMRALGGIGVGCFIGFLYKKYGSFLSEYSLKLWQKILYNLTEFAAFYFIVWWSFVPHKKVNNVLYVLVFAILFTLFVFRKGWLSKLTDKDIWVRLGKYQYSIFVIHTSVLKIWYGTFCVKYSYFVQNNPLLTYVLTYLLIITIAFFMYHCIEKPFSSLKWENIKNCLGKRN